MNNYNIIAIFNSNLSLAGFLIWQDNLWQIEVLDESWTEFFPKLVEDLNNTEVKDTAEARVGAGFVANIIDVPKEDPGYVAAVEAGLNRKGILARRITAAHKPLLIRLAASHITNEQRQQVIPELLSSNPDDLHEIEKLFQEYEK